MSITEISTGRPTRRKKKTDVVPPLVFSILAAAVIGTLLPAASPSEAAIASLGVSALVWGIAFLATVHRDPVRLGLPLWPLVILAALLPQLAVFNVHQAHLARDASEKAQMRSLANVMQEALSDVKAGRVPRQAPPAAQGDIGTAQTLATDAIRTMETDKLACQARLQSSNILHVLTGPALATDPNLRKAKAAIANAGAIIRECRATYEARLNAFPGVVLNSKLSSRAQNQMLDGFEASTATAGRLNEQVWSVQTAEVEQMRDITNLLVHARGFWVVQGAKLEFFNPSALKAFQVETANLRKLAAQEQELRAQQQAAVQAYLEQLRNSAR